MRVSKFDRRICRFLLDGTQEMYDHEWIGNTYLDDSGRDSPASLNSTGDM